MKDMIFSRITNVCDSWVVNEIYLAARYVYIPCTYFNKCLGSVFEHYLWRRRICKKQVQQVINANTNNCCFTHSKNTKMDALLL